MSTELWLLLASILLNVFFVYAWFHDVALYKRSVEMYQKSYYDTLDYHFGNPEGTTSWRGIESWPEGSELRRKEEERHRRMYGEDPRMRPA